MIAEAGVTKVVTVIFKNKITDPRRGGRVVATLIKEKQLARKARITGKLSLGVHCHPTPLTKAHLATGE